MVNYWEIMTVLTFLIPQWLQRNHLQTSVHFKLFAYELFIQPLQREGTVAVGTAGTRYDLVYISFSSGKLSDSPAGIFTYFL